MVRTISIGNEHFSSIREKNNFYIDKTAFIKEWWENEDIATLITRPRRFGKTLNMDMLRCFFSNEYKDRGDLFEGLDIWKEEKYRTIQGTYPVIFLSFAEVKAKNFRDTKNDMVSVINDLYKQHSYLLEGNILTEAEKNLFSELDAYSKNIDINKEILNEIVCRAIKDLAAMLYRYYKKKVIILLDEYDTPMQEAYINGYWDEIVSLTRSLFNSTFKTNPYLERAVMTGITRVSKESIFSDLNNLVVVTTTSNQYEEAFGFTQEEVFNALDEQGLSGSKQEVKSWYDGFRFGRKNDIYNPWSIINFLKTGEFATYWADSSSNGLVNKLIRTGSVETKETMETLISGGVVEKNIDEQIVFDQIETNKDAIWSLLLASGYLRIEALCRVGRLNKKLYTLKLTNFEVEQMFGTMIEQWFCGNNVPYNKFVEVLLSGDLESMNEYMNDVALNTFSSFDTGKNISDKKAPECFYHGFVLGLMVDQIDNYIITSNRESGFGRYDIMLEPIEKNNMNYPGIIIEFKVINAKKENSLEDTVKAALKQIKEKNYDAELIKRGVGPENIRHYGFAFRGKEVLIGN